MSFRQRIEALLVAEATSALSEAESKVLEELLIAHPEVDRYAFQRTAAAVFLAASGPPSRTMPRRLYSRMIAEAERSLPEDE